jgi:DNA-binding NtrC family response regulator
MYVDDEPDILELVSIYFTDHNLKVVTALNAQSALEAFAQHPIKVVVSDARMPGMKGVELYNVLCSQFQYTGVFILVSGNYEQGNGPSGPEGITFTITKPVDFDELAITIKRMLGN